MHTIRNLLADARKGEVVLLPRGRHTTTIVLRQSLSLVAQHDVALIGDEGSAVMVVGGDVVLEGLTLVTSRAFSGAGLFVTNGARVRLRDCRIERNSAPGFGGGAIFADSGELTLERCTIVNNLGARGGALALDGTARVTLSDCVFDGNHAGVGHVLYLRDGAELKAEGCTFRTRLPDGPLFAASGTTTRRPELTLARCIIEGPAGSPLFEGSVRSLPPRLRVYESLLSTLACSGQVELDARGCEEGCATWVDDDCTQPLADGSLGRGLVARAADVPKNDGG